MSTQVTPAGHNGSAESGPIELAGRDGRPHRFTGRLLGSGTSRAEVHTHDPARSAEPGEKCSACRWFEVAIYLRRQALGGPNAVPATFDYVVHTVGGSAVPGEDRRSRVSFTPSAYEVIELLTVRPHGGEPFIAQQSARALAQAAALDDGVREAYINRAIV